MVRIRLLVFAMSLLLWQGHGLAQTTADVHDSFVSPVRTHGASYNDYGGTGLLQMPNARFQPDGELGVTMSHVYPYYRYAATLQMLPWLESSVRYTQIQNRLYGPESFSGDQQYKDRGLDLKLKLLSEGPYNPQIALGLRDVAGSNLFTSEFLTASRRYYDFDFTLGLAWGNGGTRGHFTNPFGKIFSSMKNRSGTGGAGAVTFPFFSGETVGLFGGIEYLTPIKGLRLKLEYDGNDYSKEALGNQFSVRTPINVGVDYQLTPWAEVSGGYERGDTFMLRGTLRTNFNNFKGLPREDPPPAPIIRVKGPEPVETVIPVLPVEQEKDSLTAIRRFGSERGMMVNDVTDGLTIRIDAALGPPRTEDAAAIALFASQRLSVLVEQVSVVLEHEGRAVREIRFNRERLEQSQALTGSADALLTPVEREWALLDAGPLPAPKPIQGSTRPQPSGLADLPWSEEATKPFAEKLFAAFRSNGLTAYAVSLTDLRASVRFDNNKYRIPSMAFSRAARLVANLAPASVEIIALELQNGDMEVSRLTVMRKDLDAMAQYKGSPQEIYAHATLEAAGMDEPANAVENPTIYPAFNWSLSPKLRQHVGGPDNFYFFQFYAAVSAEMRLAKGLTVAGSIGQDIYNNFDDLKLESDSQLPHVRSDVKDYLKGSSTWIDSAFVNYNAKLSPSFYGRATAGMLELMFGGVSGEILYYPQGQSWAVGVDISRATQRDFGGQPLGFQDYSVTTGHLSWYQKLPFYNMRGAVRIGRYLAGDEGVTVELARTFENGISVGAFATKTNVSAEQFGEGSFDKGVFISIPLDLFTGTNARNSGSMLFRPLTRDGGQRLGQPELYSIVSGAGADALDQSWGQFGQ